MGVTGETGSVSVYDRTYCEEGPFLWKSISKNYSKSESSLFVFDLMFFYSDLNYLKIDLASFWVLG